MEDKKKLYGILLGVSVFALVIVGLSVAWLVWRSTNTNISLTSGCFTINYSKGQDISNAKLKLLNENDIISDNNITITTGMALTTASIGIDSSCNIEGYGILKLNVTSLSDAFTTGDSVGSLKYAVVSYNPSTYPDVTVENLNSASFTILSKGGITSTGTKEILVEQLYNSVVNNYIVIIYIDGALAGNNIIGSSFTGTINAEVVQGKVPLRVRGNVVTAINNAYTPNTTAVNNSITYNLDNVNYLMKDTAGNIRYYGASPNNYIYFNCETYPETNCELWRIIGVFGDKVKIIRNEIIDYYSWDTSASDVNSGYGINEWSQADLMKILNPGYESNTDLNRSGTSITVNNSLYYNLGSGTCYNGRNNTTTSCDFTSTGIKNDTTRNMISDSIYYLGGGSKLSIYSNAALTMERGTTVISSPSDGIKRTTRWTGKIGLMYPSDYGYATDFSKCTQNLYSYGSSTDSYVCRSNDWLYNSAYQWLLTPNSSNASRSWFVSSSGEVYNANNVYSAFGVRPVLYLNSSAIIGSGSGTEADPYRIS